MNSIFKVVVRPHGSRYVNTIDVAGSDFVINTDIDERDYQYVNRIAEVLVVPKNSNLKVGDLVLVHHNAFRQYWGFTGLLMQSGSSVGDGTYGVLEDDVYAYKRDGEWFPNSNWLIVGKDGEVFLSNVFESGEMVMFPEYAECEIGFEGEVYYRMENEDVICSTTK